MLAGLILGVTLVVALLLFVQMLKTTNSKNRYFLGFSMIGLLAAGSIVTVVLHSQSSLRADFGAPADDGIALTEIARISAGLRRPAPGPEPASTVAPVPSLIDGLEQRLQSNPGDGRGWALLAQSYAFTGQTDLAEQALLNAVELGLDEADLRSRVANAERSPHAGLAAVTSVQ